MDVSGIAVVCVSVFVCVNWRVWSGKGSSGQDHAARARQSNGGGSGSGEEVWLVLMLLTTLRMLDRNGI